MVRNRIPIQLLFTYPITKQIIMEKQTVKLSGFECEVLKQILTASKDKIQRRKNINVGNTVVETKYMVDILENIEKQL